MRKTESGFTLIEVLAVIVIIGIMAAIAATVDLASESKDRTDKFKPDAPWSEAKA